NLFLNSYQNSQSPSSCLKISRGVYFNNFHAIPSLSKTDEYFFSCKNLILDFYKSSDNLYTRIIFGHRNPHLFILSVLMKRYNLSVSQCGKSSQYPNDPKELDI